MRKLFNLFAAALVVLAAVSCEKNENILPDSNLDGKVVTLSATINNGGTKTSLGSVKDSERKYPVYWSEGDEIAVIQEDDESENYLCVYTFTLSTGGGTTSATFRCENAGDFDPEKDYRAVYPASAVLKDLEDKFVGYSFSGTQTYKQNSFGEGVMPMETNMYKGQNQVLEFSNVFGVLKLQLKGASDEKVTSIVITSDKALNGNAKLISGEIKLQGTEDANKQVTLDCSAVGGVALNPETATDFLISVPEGVHNFTITINSTIGDTPKTYPLTTTQTIDAGVIKKMAVKDLGLAYIENGVYLGDGVAIPCTIGGETKTLIWAPVNCGYHKTDYPYGKMYQWGRKDGQGYAPFQNGNGSSDNGATAKFSSDALPETLAADTFYSKWSATEWTEENSPCPAGWRVPTLDDVKGVKVHYSNMVTVNSLQGRWICGANEYEAGMPNAIFLYAAGVLYTKYGTANCNGKGLFRGSSGHYYTSTLSNEGQAYYMAVNGSNGSNGVYYSTDGNKSNACSVRCVKDEPQASSFSNN